MLVVLPVSSSSHSALEEQLAEALRAAGVEPVLSGAQNSSFSPEQREALEGLELAAEQAELALELDEAADRRREIVDFLESAGATATDPARLAEALARQASTAVEAGRRDAALRLWRRALALRADLQLDSTFSPSVREVFDEAVEQGATLPPRPEVEALDRLCEALDVAAVLWVAVGYDEGYELGDVVVVRVFHRAGTSTPSEVRHGLGRVELGESLVLPDPLIAGLRRELSSLTRASEERDGGPAIDLDAGLDADLEADLDAHPEAGLTPRPWYRQWWFYLTIGVVVAGAATATGLTLGLGERQVDVVVRLP